MLTLENITKKYKNFLAVENINLELENGVYGFLAPNGAGKTTIIKMIATLLFPNKGKILYNGDDILALDENYRGILGYLPQDFGYYKSWTPKQYLTYLSVLKGMNEKDGEEEVLELLELVGLKDVVNKKMKQFSGGMVQRVGIAQALLNNPKIVVLDEPTAGLDPKERLRFRNILASLSKDKIIIISTHIVSDVENLANRIIMLKDKKLLYNEKPEKLIEILNGKVFEKTMTENEYFEFTKKYTVLSSRLENGLMNIRYIDENSMNTNSLKPNLEDVFLYIFGDSENDLT